MKWSTIAYGCCPNSFAHGARIDTLALCERVTETLYAVTTVYPSADNKGPVLRLADGRW